MGVKKIMKGFGSGAVNGVKSVGKGVFVASTAVVSKTFLIAQIAGLVFTITGLVIVVIMAFQKVSLFNMKALFKMITGVVFALCGIILIGVSYGIRWKHRMVNRVGAIEEKWRDAKRTPSSLRRAYNINKCAKNRSRKGSQV